MIRVGIGHDTHRLEDGGPLILGGIVIPHTKKMVGHSDADVLLHAVTDAILGAAAMGDIGEIFPDNLEENRNRDSAEMLKIAFEKARSAGFMVENLDCIIFAQQPKLSKHKPQIQKRISEILALEPDRIGIKAKTGEGIGPIGTEQAISAQCVALLSKE